VLFPTVATSLVPSAEEATEDQICGVALVDQVAPELVVVKILPPLLVATILIPLAEDATADQ
jgi:hypothetical protein